MPKREVIIANEPPLLRDLLRHVLAQDPEIQVREGGAHALPVGDEGESWFVVALDDHGQIARRFLRRLHRQTQRHGFKVHVLGLAPDGSRARVYSPHKGDRVWELVTLEDLVRIIKANDAS